jgi:hypothetical protein
MPTVASLSIGKNYLVSNAKLDSSNRYLDQIKSASNYSKKLDKSFEEISKNDGIAFIFLDPSETHLQLLHHGQILGGNWSSPTKHMVAVLGSNIHAKPIQIVEKPIKNVKEKSFTIEEYAESLEDINSFMSMKNPKIEFLYKNIIAILNFVIKSFIQLEDTSNSPSKA